MPTAHPDSLRHDLTMMQRLKQATASLHARVEQCVDLHAATTSIDAFISLHYQFAYFYAPLERHLRTLPWDSLGLEFEQRRKMPKLIAAIESLTHLGATPMPVTQRQSESNLDLSWDAPPFTHPPRLPEIRNISQGLGCLYVLEGATLGGMFIFKHAAAQLNLDADAGCQFFYGYGGDTGLMWQKFGEIINKYAGSNSAVAAQLITSAEDTFKCFEAWFSSRSNT